MCNILDRLHHEIDQCCRHPIDLDVQGGAEAKCACSVARKGLCSPYGCGLQLGQSDGCGMRREISRDCDCPSSKIGAVTLAVAVKGTPGSVIEVLIRNHVSTEQVQVSVHGESLCIVPVYMQKSGPPCTLGYEGRLGLEDYSTYHKGAFQTNGN